MTYSRAKALLQQYGQTQVLEYYDELSAGQQSALLSQIENMDFSGLAPGGEQTMPLGELSPVPALSCADVERDKERYVAEGLKAIRSGKVAAVLLAGGQGTRLGSDKPKGMFNMGLSRELSIFACQFINIKKVTDMAGVCFHIFVMTSVLNHDDTVAFFKENDFFGYPSDKIHFFVQEMAPNCDICGKLLLESKWKISSSPNGNGGWYSSLVKGGFGALLEDEGIEWLNVYSVDNVLQRICDPVFVGATIESGCNCSSKVVKKVSPEERVGVLCMQNGQPSIVEYYEMPPEKAALRRPDGELVFAYGVTLNYLFRVELLNKTLAKKLPVHRSLKIIPYMSEGRLVIPQEPNGYKSELLVLDMIKFMGSCLAVEVVRESEFAPVKNRTGADSVETARVLLQKNGVRL